MEFDDNNIENIAKLVFNGMRFSENRSGELSKNELKTWTKAIMAKKHPNMKFDEKMFEKGFSLLDVNKDGFVNL